MGHVTSVTSGKFPSLLLRHIDMRPPMDSNFRQEQYIQAMPELEVEETDVGAVDIKVYGRNKFPFLVL